MTHELWTRRRDRRSDGRQGARRLGGGGRVDRLAHGAARRAVHCPARPQPRRPRFRRPCACARRRGAGRSGAGRRERGGVAGRSRGHHGCADCARAGGASTQQGTDRRAHRQRRQDRHQRSVAPRARRAGADPCQRGEPQQSLGRAAECRPGAARHGVWHLRARHECARRDRHARPAGPAARRHDHHGRGGSPRVLQPRSKRSRTPRARSSRGWSRAAWRC